MPLTARHPVARRVVLAVALAVLLLFPLPGLAADTGLGQPPCQNGGCGPVSAEQWHTPLSGSWAAGTGPGISGDGGTVPAAGQAYVAVDGSLAVVGTGLTVTAYRASNGRQAWRTVLRAPAGTVIMSVRAWPGVVTVGLLSPDGSSRAVAVLDGTTGRQLRSYPATLLGGAVAATRSATIVVGSSFVTSYNNATGGVRWRHSVVRGQDWQVDGQTLYLAESRAGALAGGPVTALGVVNLSTGTERRLTTPLDRPYSGTLASVVNGVVLFASSAGVTAYSGATGDQLWTSPGAVPEGSDPDSGLAYLTMPGGAMDGVDPVTGVVRASVPAAVTANGAGLFVVRDGVALGLGGGANGTAWGYDITRSQVGWTSGSLPWPHFYTDLSGLGGSAAVSGDLVVVTACRHLAAAPGLCAAPELVAFRLLPHGSVTA